MARHLQVHTGANSGNDRLKPESVVMQVSCAIAWGQRGPSNFTLAASPVSFHHGADPQQPLAGWSIRPLYVPVVAWGRIGHPGEAMPFPRKAALRIRSAPQTGETHLHGARVRWEQLMESSCLLHQILTDMASSQLISPADMDKARRRGIEGRLF